MLLAARAVVHISPAEGSRHCPIGGARARVLRRVLAAVRNVLAGFQPANVACDCYTDALRSTVERKKTPLNLLAFSASPDISILSGSTSLPHCSVAVFRKIRDLGRPARYNAVAQMALLMTRPTKHPKTGIYLIRMAVPAALRGIIGQRELKRGLGDEGLRRSEEAGARHRRPVRRRRSLRRALPAVAPCRACAADTAPPSLRAKCGASRGRAEGRPRGPASLAPGSGPTHRLRQRARQPQAPG